MKNYCWIVALLATLSPLVVIASDITDSTPLSCMTMKAPIYPLEHFRYNNVRPTVDRMLREGETAFNKNTGCFLTKHKEGDVHVLIAGWANQASQLQAAHIIVCARVKKDAQDEHFIRQATLVGTTYSGGSDKKERHVKLLTTVGKLLTKRGYTLSRECSRVQTNEGFDKSGFAERVHSERFVYDKTHEIFNTDTPYCSQISCWQRPECLQHPGALDEHHFGWVQAQWFLKTLGPR